MAQKSNKVEIRVTDLEKKDWQEAAGGARLVSSWLRALANAEAARLRAGTEAGLEVVETLVAKGADAVIAETKIPLSTEGLIAPMVPSPEPNTSNAQIVKPTAEQCPRWMHHRKGTYCGACKKVQ